MDITPLVGAGQQIIQGYGEGRYRIAGNSYDAAVIVFPARTMAWDARRPLTVESFHPLLDVADTLDVVLWGCGAAVGADDLALRRALKGAGLSVDIMDTGAACRTYNVLLAEGRRVAAALLPV